MDALRTRMVQINEEVTTWNIQLQLEGDRYNRKLTATVWRYTPGSAPRRVATMHTEFSAVNYDLGEI